MEPDKNVDEKYHGKRERDGDDRVAFGRPWRFDDLIIGRCGLHAIFYLVNLSFSGGKE